VNILIPIQKVRKKGMSILLRSKSPRRDKHIPIPRKTAFRLFELEWVYLVVDEKPTLNADALIALMTRLEERNKCTRVIYIILDNANSIVFCYNCIYL
jgi:hypothetical protein